MSCAEVSPLGELPNVDPALFEHPTGAQLAGAGGSSHAPRLAMRCGSLRERCYSKLLTLEGGRLLGAMGAEVRIFDPSGLPLPDGAPDSHPEVQELCALAVMQVSGGSQSFSAVNPLRILGHWMRMITIPNQSSVAKAFQEFDAAGRMKPSACCERVVDVMEKQVKFTLPTRHVAPYLVDRCSERCESAQELSRRVNQSRAVT